VDRELYLNFTREEIRKEILRKLDLKAPPNVSAASVPQHLIRQLMDKYRHELGSVNVMNDDPIKVASMSPNGQFVMEEDDDFHFQTRQINVLAQNAETILPQKLTRQWEIQYFSLDSPQLMDGLWRNVVRARMYLHMPAATSPEDKDVFINTYYVAVDKTGHSFLKQARTTKAELLPEQGGWVDINVWDLVSAWLKDPTTNLGFVLSVKTGSGVEIPVGVQHQQLPGNIPYLQLEIRDSAWNARKKRTLSKVCSESDENAESHCCLWPFTVDFEKTYGWTFIISPPSYEANYCSGDCSLGVMMPENPYGHIMQQSNISPCCTPKKMSGINMLYMDENRNIILGILPKMKVERCGCA
jgi:hypothetical protein